MLGDYKQLSDFTATGSVTANDLIYSQNVTTGVEQKTTVRQLQAFILSGIQNEVVLPQRQTLVALTNNQAVYPTITYTPGVLNLYIAGARVSPSLYQANDGQTVTITDPTLLSLIEQGLQLEMEAPFAMNLANAATPASVAALDPANQPAISNLIGSAITSVRQGSALFQTSLTKIAAFVLGTATQLIGSATGLVPRSVLAELGDLAVSVKRFGALGNVINLTDGVIHATRFGSNTANFTAADVGKTIVLEKVGPSGTSLVTTIVGFISATQVTLANPGSVVVGSIVFYYGNDDTAAIQAACAAMTGAANANGELYFPPGIYFYNSSTFSDVSNGVTVRGANRTSSVIMSTNPTANIFYVWQLGSAVKHLGITSAATQTGGCFIQLAGTQNVVEDVAISGDYLGINLTGVAAKIRNVVYSNGASGSVRLNINCGDASPVLSDILMMGQAAPYPAAGIQCQNVTALTMSNISTLNQTIGLSIVPGQGQGVNNIQADNCFFDSGTNGMQIQPSGNGSVSRLNFVNCWTGDSSANGVDISNPGTGIVVGLNFVNHQSPICGGSGIATAGICSDISVLGGLFGQSQDGLYFGHTGTVKVIGAKCGAYEGTSGNSNSGIVFTGSLTEIVCQGVSALGNTLNGIVDQSSNSIVKFINNNIEPDYVKAGQITVTGSPFTYTAPYDQMVTIASGTVTAVVVGGQTLFGVTNVSVMLRRGESVTVTYTGTIYMYFVA